MRCPIHLSVGQEAIAVGICDNLKDRDQIVGNHRCHAHYLAKGGDLENMIDEFYEILYCSGEEVDQCIYLIQKRNPC